MNEIQYLLVCLAEECAEVQQEVGKALRFGLDHDWPNDKNSGTNAERIKKELTDLLAIVELLESRGAISGKLDLDAIANKQSKVIQFMAYARERGTLA